MGKNGVRRDAHPFAFFLYCKIGVFVRRKLQNFAKLCKKMQKFARKFAYIKKMYYLCNVFRKRAGTNPKKLTTKQRKNEQNLQHSSIRTG